MKKLISSRKMLCSVILLPWLIGSCQEGPQGSSSLAAPLVSGESSSFTTSDGSQSSPSAAVLAQPIPKVANDVILQLFNWPFQMITEEMPLLAELGYGQIHVSPPNLTISSDQWWGRYQPVDYRLIDGPLGNEAQFKAMIDTAHQYGIRILIDVVLNHTANESFPSSPSATRLVEQLGPLFTPQDYHPEACITDYNNPFQVRRNRLCGAPGDRGLPDLDHSSPRVLAAQKAFVDKLINLGVDGFRIDAMKHIDPDYFHRLFTPEQRKKFYFFGEVITESQHFDRDLAPYIQATSFSFYDFPLRETIQKAFGFGGYLGDLVAPDLVMTKRSLPWNRSVTFVMAHDIPNNDVFRPMIMDPIDEMLAYGYILGRSEGVPYVYSDLGKSNGAGLRDERWAFAHRSPMLGKMLQFHNRVRGALQQNLVANACLVVFTRDQKGLVAINKCAESVDINVDPRWDGIKLAYEVFSETTVPVTAQGRDMRLKIPGRSVRMYLAGPGL